jgi:hypothetical protein
MGTWLRRHEERLTERSAVKNEKPAVKTAAKKKPASARDATATECTRPT